MFNTANVFGPFTGSQTFILTVKSNGGSVALQVEHAPGVYVTAQTFSANGAHQLFPGRARFRLVPAAGAEYSLR